MLVFGVFLAIFASPAAAEFTFDQYEVVIVAAERQTVLTGFLFGGAVADLAVVNIDENGDRRLCIYAFGDSTWVPLLDATLRPTVLFVDVANIGGRDRLIAYESGRLNWFDPESATEHALVAVTSNFNPPRSGEIPHVDVTRDVNGDQRDDLVVPDVDGFWVFVQMSDGAFADPVKIGPPTEMSRIYGADGYRYNPWSQSRVHGVDYNRDLPHDKRHLSRQTKRHSQNQNHLARRVRGKSSGALPVRADRGCERRQTLGPAGAAGPERTARLSRRAGAGPVHPTTAKGGGRRA